MYSNQVRQRIRGLVAGIGPSIAANPDQLEAKLADLAAANPEDVRLIVTAAKGGVAEEIAAAAPEHRADLVEQASAWMASEAGVSPEDAKWAVETWSMALEGVQIAPAPQAPVAPAAVPTPASSVPPPAPWDRPAQAPAPTIAPGPVAYGAPQTGYPQQAGYPPQAGYPQAGYPQAGYPQAGYQGPGYPADPTNPRSYSRAMTDVSQRSQPNTTRFVLAIVVSLVIACVGSSLIMMLFASIHHSWAILYLLVAVGVAFSLVQIAGTGGNEGMAFIGCGVLVVGMAVGHLVFVAEEASNVGLSFGDALPHTFSFFTPVHWIFLAISLVACFRIILRQR